MDNTNQTVFVVDDDAAVLKALARLLSAHGFSVETFTSAKAFLERHDPSVPGCLVLDVAMPELTGLELQKALSSSFIRRMIVFLSGQSDIPMAIRAMRAGAVHFLTKPPDEQELLAAVHEALEKDRIERLKVTAEAASRARFATLTPRERQVMQHVVAGQLNKQIARELGTVEKTVKVHRGRVMKKMAARSLADLVRIALRLGLGRPL